MIKKERLRNKFVKFVKFKLKSSFALTLHNTLSHRINVAVKRRVKAIKTRYLKRLSNLLNERSAYSKNINQMSFIKNTVNSVLSHTLAEHKYNVLAFGLDYHISTRTNRNNIDIEFELYFRIINCYLNEIPDNIVCYLKTKLRNI